MKQNAAAKSGHPSSYADKPITFRQEVAQRLAKATETESINIYPAGRGHIVQITKKRVICKQKEYTRHNPRFNHCHIKSNPEPISFVEYLNQDGINEETIKRIILYPENRQLSRQERLDIIASLLITTITYNVVSKRYKETVSKTLSKTPHFLTQELYALVKKKWKRYVKWRMKNS